MCRLQQNFCFFMRRKLAARHFARSFCAKVTQQLAMRPSSCARLEGVQCDDISRQACFSSHRGQMTFSLLPYFHVPLSRSVWFMHIQRDTSQRRGSWSSVNIAKHGNHLPAHRRHGKQWTAAVSVSATSGYSGAGWIERCSPQQQSRAQMWMRHFHVMWFLQVYFSFSSHVVHANQSTAGAFVNGASSPLDECCVISIACLFHWLGILAVLDVDETIRSRQAEKLFSLAIVGMVNISLRSFTIVTCCERKKKLI